MSFTQKKIHYKTPHVTLVLKYICNLFPCAQNPNAKFLCLGLQFLGCNAISPHKEGSIEPPPLGVKNPKNCKKKNTNPKCFQNISHQS